MQGKALVCDEQQRFTFTDVILPEPGDDDVLINTTCSGVSIGTEFALIRNKISWGPYPICTGYQAVGVVEKVGSNVDGYKPGDKVYYRDNKRMQLPDGTKVSAVTGTHSSPAVVNPKNTIWLDQLPDGVPDDIGSMFVMPAVGLHGVDMSNPRLGETVLVYGTGLIGLGVVSACANRGCVVIAVDIDDRNLDMARRMGADYTINGSRENVLEEVKKIKPDLADVVFEATGIPACLDPAIALCRRFGKFIWQGNYGAAPISIHFLPPHGKQLTTFFPSNDGVGPCRRAVVKNMASGALPWEKTITHRIKAEESAEFFTRINDGNKDNVLGGVIMW